MLRRAILFAALTLGTAASQEFDTANFGRKPMPLADNAESAAERKAFAALVRANKPARKKLLALEFVSRFPASWLLASAWQAAATACVDLNDHAGVIEYGRRSLALRPENPLLLIAVARAEVLQGDRGRAKRDARDALLWLSVLAGPSAIPAEKWQATRKSLEDYARRVVSGGSNEAPAPVREARENFAGSAQCQPCHEAIYKAWLETGMATMLKPRQSARVLADFSRTTDFPAQGGRAEARMGGGDKPYFEFRMPGGGWKRFSVDYTIGSKWQQAYATTLADGRLFVFPVQFNALTREWLNYWQRIDPPKTERSRVSHFPDLTEVTSYQRNCAVCHTSQLRIATTGGHWHGARCV